MLTSSYLVLLTLYLKYDAVRNLNQEKSHLIKAIIIMLAPVLSVAFLEAIIIINQALPSEIQDRFRLINSDVTDHSVIGYITLSTVPSVLIFIIVSCTVFLFPPIGFYVRRKILKYVNSNQDRFSTFKKLQNQSFINGLTLQAFLPLLCFIPIFICFFVLIITKTEVLFEQYFIGVVTIVPTIFDPYITLYAVSPYRKQIKIWLGIQKVEPMVMVTAHSQVI
uniref:G_PROTEIN_RECEP_F1_2 domain-containing protein n=1 Tax=Caenorhabditis tropicalis TaxID=1561998 RepID=A0A1I7TN80_9PELO